MVIFRFQPLPRLDGGQTTWPVADVRLGDLRALHQCLLDTGSRRSLFGRWVAELLRVDTSGPPDIIVGAGGSQRDGWVETIDLQIGPHHWEADVVFCDPWPFTFQILGLEGFFRHFDTMVSAVRETVEVEPVDR